MNERVHRALDGERLEEGLSRREAAERDAYEAAIAEALSGVPRAELPDLAPEVMRRIEALEAGATDRRRAAAPPWRRLLRALWAPRPISISLRPAYGLAAAVLVAGLVWLAAPLLPRGPAGGAGTVAVGAGRATGSAAGGAVAGGAATGAAAGVSAAAGVRSTAAVASPAAPAAGAALRVFVRFRLDAPGARTVALAGDFTDWKPAVALHQVAAGIWSVELPVATGIHSYAFVIDGHRWVTDPAAPRVSDGFGGWNSQVAVLPPQSGTAS